MTDLEQARSVEAVRLKQALRDLESQQEWRLSRIDAEMSRRGLQHSDARLNAIFEARLERLNQAILQRIAIRKEMVRKCPELGSPAELNHLKEVIHADVMDLRAECKKLSLLAPPEVFAELHARAQDGIEGLKREMALQVRVEPKLPAFSLNISHGGADPQKAGPRVQAGVARPVPAAGSPAIGPSEAPFRKVDEVITDLEERNRSLADALRHLAAVIKEARRLPDERTVYLEQVQFLAEQASRVAVLRRVSVVKGIMLALRTDLGEVLSVVPALRKATPLIESHFGIKGTSD